MPIKIDFKNVFGKVKKLTRTIQNFAKRANPNFNKNTRLIAQEAFITGMSIEGSKYLKKDSKKKLKPETLKRLKPYTAQKQKGGLKIVVESNFTIPYTDFPFKKVYRDPKIGTGIHQGASFKFKRYAITQVKVLGKNTSAGRKGTKLQGLGYEPMGTRPKSSSGKYVGFIRTGYPGRKLQNWPKKPDTGVTIYQKKGASAQFPLYYELIKRKKHREGISKYIQESIETRGKQIITLEVEEALSK